MRLPVQVTGLEGEVLDLKGQLTDLEAIRLDLEGHVQDLSEELQGAAAERTDKAKAVKVRVVRQAVRQGSPSLALFSRSVTVFICSLSTTRSSSSSHPWCLHCQLHQHHLLYLLKLGGSA